MQTNMIRRFGRKPSPFDARDYNLRNFIPLGADLTLDTVDCMSWEYPDPPLDQLDTQHCLGFSMAAFGINLPVYRHYTVEDAHKFYYMCKELEGDPLNESGAYARSAAEVLLAMKNIEAYAFAPDTTVIKWWLLNRGPLMVGSMWMQGMMTPDADNIVHATGSLRGGHAYLINEWTRDNFIGIQNSWGNTWGVHGKAYISLADFEILFKYYCEAITAVDLEDAVVPFPEVPEIEKPEEPIVIEPVEPPVIIEPVEPPEEPEIVIPPPTNPGCSSVFWSLFKNGMKE